MIRRHKQLSEHPDYSSGVPFFTIIGSRTNPNGVNKSSLRDTFGAETVSEGDLHDELQRPTAAFDVDEQAKTYVRDLERQLTVKSNELEQAALYARKLESGLASSEATLASSAQYARRLEAELASSAQDARRLETALKLGQAALASSTARETRTGCNPAFYKLASN